MLILSVTRSVAEYCWPVWSKSRRITLIKVQLHVTGFTLPATDSWSKATSFRQK